MQFLNILDLSKILHFTDHVTGYEDIWLIGDDFAANTYHQSMSNMRNAEEQFYMKKNFEVKTFLVKSHTSHMRSILSRILA